MTLEDDRTAGTSTQNTRQRIIEAAAETFAERGYARATTRVIAATAGVTEVTLFRHFGNKQNLFAAVLDQYSITSDYAALLQSQLSGDFRQDMLLLGNHFMRVMLDRREAVRLMLCEADHFPELREVLVQMPRQLRLTLAKYLRGQIEQGQIRDLHPEIMAQAFWGMIFSYQLTQVIFAEPIAPEMPLEEIVAQFVDIFVDGISKE